MRNGKEADLIRRLPRGAERDFPLGAAFEAQQLLHPLLEAQAANVAARCARAVRAQSRERAYVVGCDT